MGWFDYISKSKQTPMVTLRDPSVARRFPVEFPGNGARRGDVKACAACGAKLDEVLVTTGGADGDPNVWRAHPVAVDGWRCKGCGNIKVPRFLEPDEVTTISKAAIAAAEAGDFDAAELGFRRVVSSWPTFGHGRHDLAQVLAKRLRAEQLGEARGFVELALLDSIEAQLQKALRLGPQLPRGRIIWALVNAFLAREQPYRANELLTAEREASGIPQGELEDIERYVRLRGDLYERGTEAIKPYMRLQGASPKPIDAQGRKRIERGVDDLRRHADLNPSSWQALWIAAKGLQALDDHEACVALFERAFTAHPANPNVGREYALELLNIGRAEEAVKVAQQASDASPTNAGLVANLAIAQLLAQDVDGARSSAERAVALDGNDAINREVLSIVRACAFGTRPIPRTMRELEGGSR